MPDGVSSFLYVPLQCKRAPGRPKPVCLTDPSKVHVVQRVALRTVSTLGV
jgi:hypothetical protein